MIKLDTMLALSMCICVYVLLQSFPLHANMFENIGMMGEFNRNS